MAVSLSVSTWKASLPIAYCLYLLEVWASDAAPDSLAKRQDGDPPPTCAFIVLKSDSTTILRWHELWPLAAIRSNAQPATRHVAA